MEEDIKVSEIILDEFNNIDESDFIEEEKNIKQEIFQCSSCNFTFTDVTEHLSKYHDGEGHKIKEEASDEEIIFEQVDSENEEISLALIVKNNDGKYECNECPKTFKAYKRFVTHLKSHHSLTIEDFSAMEHGNSTYEIIRNSNGSNQYRCKLCNSIFDTRKSLLLHIPIHKNVEDAQNAAIEQIRENINCQLCNKTFNCKLDFDLHIQAHDENKASTSNKVVPKKEAISGQKGKIHACQYCGKEFKRPHEKVKHERIHSGLKPYSCDICGKKFRVTYCLSLHKRNVHSDDRPYICTFPGCNKKFKAQSVYNHHINTHSDERKFQCPFCPKTFKTSVQLAGHKNTHTKPFSCKICKRPFASLYAVKNHMETHKQEDSNLNMTCKICGAQYARSFALKDHMRTTHSNEMEVEIEEYVIESDMDVNNGDSELYSVVLSSENADN